MRCEEVQTLISLVWFLVVYVSGEKVLKFNLFSFLDRQGPYTHEKFLDAATRLVVIEDLPIDIVECQSFWKLQATLRPDSRFTSSCTLKTNIHKKHGTGMGKLTTLILVLCSAIVLLVSHCLTYLPPCTQNLKSQLSCYCHHGHLDLPEHEGSTGCGPDMDTKGMGACCGCC